MIASGSGQPEDGFDCDRNTFRITGGVVFGAGGSTSSPTPSASTQAAVICNGISAAGTVFNISDPEGNSVVSCVLPRTMGSMCVLVSAPQLVQGAEYSVSTGGSENGAKSVWYGYYEGGSYWGGTTAASFTQTSSVTTIGSGGNGGGHRDGPGDHPDGGRKLWKERVLWNPLLFFDIHTPEEFRIVPLFVRWSGGGTLKCNVRKLPLSAHQNKERNLKRKSSLHLNK